MLLSYHKSEGKSIHLRSGDYTVQKPAVEPQKRLLYWQESVEKREISSDPKGKRLKIYKKPLRNGLGCDII